MSGYFIFHFLSFYFSHIVSLVIFFKNDDITTEDHQRTVDNIPINGSDQQQENVLWLNPGEDSNWGNNQPACTSETPDEETPQ